MMPQLDSVQTHSSLKSEFMYFQRHCRLSGNISEPRREILPKSSGTAHLITVLNIKNV